MSYRDRREAKAARLREWADKREVKAQATAEHASEIRNVIPIGQPILIGHHSERRHRNAIDKLMRADQRAYEDSQKAAEMRRKADNIEAAADRAIYSDDEDAIERLRERLAGSEAQRETMKAANAAFRREHKDEMKALSPYQRDLAMPHQKYELANLGGNISRYRKRLAQMERGVA